jgi:chemotaxis protein histidine kinase CheA/ActR/RegA family two-component response regulator
MLNLAKAEMVAKLELLLQQLSTFEAIDQTLEDLSHLAQADFIGLTFVNYLRRYTERGGDRTALRDLINTLSHSLNDGAIDREQLLGELINQANQLEARTGIYPSTSDGFEDSGKICTDKLEELFIRQQAEEDTTLLKEEIKQLASTYGMFRLLKYIDRFDEQEDYQLVRTLLLQGQEYRIGSQDDREELLESTTLSATAADWGVEEFLVNPPPTQETDDVFVSFIDQSEDTSFADSTAFRSLFDTEEEEESQLESQNVEADIQFELVEEEQGVDLDNIFAEEEQDTLHQEEGEPIISERIAEESTDDFDFSFEEIESGQHEQDIVNINLEEEQSFNLSDQTEDIQATSSAGSAGTVDDDLNFSLIEEESQSNFDVFGQTEEVSLQLESEGQTLTIEESRTSTDITQDTEELTFSLIEEDVNNQQRNIDIFAGEFTPEPIGEREMFSSASDSSDYDLLSLQEISLTEETGLGEASVLTAEAVSDLSVPTDPPEFLQSLSQEERQDVTEILDTFPTSTVSSRTSLRELGLLELVLEAIGNDDSRIDYSAILSAEPEELVSTISEGERIVHEHEVDQSLEGVTVATDDDFEPTDNQDEDVFAQLDLGEAVSTEDASLSSYVEVEEDMTVLQGVPQFFTTISNEDESDLGILEETTEESTEQSVELVQGEEEPIVAVDESEFSFLETATEESSEQLVEFVQEEEESIVAVDESEFSFLETAIEENEEQSAELVEEEPIVASDESEFSFPETLTEEVSEQSVELAQDEEQIVAVDESEFSFLETGTEESTEQSVELAQDEEQIVVSDESEFSFLERVTEESEEQSFESAQEDESIVASDESEFSFLETAIEENEEQSAELVEEEPIVASDESEFSFLETPTEESTEQSVEFVQEEESIVAVDESEFSFLETAIEESSEQSVELVQDEEPIVAVDESEFSFVETATEESSEQSVELVQDEEEPIATTSASDDLPEEEMTILQGLPEFFSSIGTEEAIEESVDDLLTDISQLSSAEEAEQSPIDNDNVEDEINALLSEISTTIPHTTEEDNDSIATEQQTDEFLNDASTSTEDDDIQQELDQLLSDLSQEEEEEEINIRQFDEETEVINFEQIFEAENKDADIDISSFSEDSDESDELDKLFADISDEEVENLTNALTQDDGDDSGFFFSQRIDSQPQDDDSEITLLQLFTGDNNEDNVDVPGNVLDDLEEYLEDEQPMSDTNAVTDNVFAELEALLADDSPSSVVDISSELDELESLISQTTPSTSAKKENFDDLDALLGSMPPSKVETKNKTVTPQTKTALSIAPPPGPTTRSTMAQNMRVDVRYLDNINNLVGELIVNRNLLQQDQQRLQASLATLFNQIHKLNDVAQRVRDEFDRSLLERSLQASLGHAWKEIGDSNSEQTKTVAVKSAQTTDALARLDEHDELNNLALDIIELITRVKESASDVEFVIDETEQVSRQLGTITAQIEDDLKQVRMEPFSEISDRLPKQVRDLAMKRKKLADIEISGRETMIDKVILQGLNTPINHLITNALVHGIEDPEQRKLAGKDPRGKITVKAYHQGNETIISISDDGAGINPEKVRQSAISKGLLTVAEARLLSDQDTYSLLFRPGFSTKAEVDEEGGRGVGLDAVITQLNAIKGSIQVESAIGKGTTFTIRLPLTLSISKAVVCICNRNRVAFPVDSFEDVVEITKDQVFVNSNGQTCFMWRDREMPFRPLKDLLIYNRQIGRLGFIKQEEDIISIIVLRSERNFLALQVDKFDGEIEIVIKQVEGPVAKPPGIAGVTVLGDGRVMAICNVLELFGIASGTINLVKHDQQTADTSNQVKATTVLVVDDSVTMRKALVQTFEKAGYRVEEARNGKEAWDKLTSGLFCDLIFTDVEMPQMNGFQLLEKLQKDEQLSRIPVAMLTSQGKRIHIENAANLGAKAYFVKAYTDQEVLEGAERLLRGQVAGKILELFGQ